MRKSWSFLAAKTQLPTFKRDSEYMEAVRNNKKIQPKKKNKKVMIVRPEMRSMTSDPTHRLSPRKLKRTVSWLSYVLPGS